MGQWDEPLALLSPFQFPLRGFNAPPPSFRPFGVMLGQFGPFRTSKWPFGWGYFDSFWRLSFPPGPWGPHFVVNMFPLGEFNVPPPLFCPF